MGHVPFGYKIINGDAHVFEEEALKIKNFFKNYLSGLSLKKAAKNAGIDTYHGTAGRMLRNKRYLGDDFYPAIIEKEIFEKAEAEREKRARSMGRIFESKIKKEPEIITDFSVGQITEEYSDPFLQAEYLYSLIKEEEVQDGS
ncbi:MAG: recombinase family protein [Erysipelotrichaceae bacterium]